MCKTQISAYRQYQCVILQDFRSLMFIGQWKHAKLNKNTENIATFMANLSNFTVSISYKKRD